MPTIGIIDWLADIVAMPDNPVVDITAIDWADFVMKNGEIVRCDGK